MGQCWPRRHVCVSRCKTRHPRKLATYENSPPTKICHPQKLATHATNKNPLPTPLIKTHHPRYQSCLAPWFPALSTCTFDQHLTWRANPITNTDPRSIDSTAQAVHRPQTTGTIVHSEIFGELFFSSNAWTLQPPPWTFTQYPLVPPPYWLLYYPSPHPLPHLHTELIIRIIVAAAEFHHKRRWIAIKYGWGQIISYSCCIISFSTQNVSIGLDQRCLYVCMS